MEAVSEELMVRGYLTPNDLCTAGEDDSASIQNAVDLAAGCGLNKVVIPRYNARTGAMRWVFDRPVLLPSDMAIVLDNCFLTLADGVYANFFRTANIYTERGLDIRREYENISITGIGTAVLDGGQPNDLSELTQYRDGRPAVRYNTPILFFNVRYFTVENLTIRDQRYWGLCFQYCKCGRIANIRMDVCGDRRNQDGINLRNGCNNIIIENIYGQTGDDMIALSAIDTPREDRYNVTIPEWDNDIHHVVIRNISGWALDHPLVALRNHNGAKLYNVIIENIQDTALVRECPKGSLPKYAIIRIGNNFYYKTRPSVMGETSDIYISNVIARTSDRAVTISATLKNSRFTNIRCYERCGAAVSINPVWAGDPGAQIENLTVDGVTLAPTETGIESAVVDFNTQRPGDYVRGMYVRDVHVDGADHLANLSGDTELTFENVRAEHLRAEAVKIRAGDEDRIKLTMK